MPKPKSYKVIFTKGETTLYAWTKVCRLLLLDRQLTLASSMFGCDIVPKVVRQIYENGRLVWNEGKLVDPTDYELKYYKKTYHPMKLSGLASMKCQQLLKMQNEWFKLVDK